MVGRWQVEVLKAAQVEHNRKRFRYEAGLVEHVEEHCASMLRELQQAAAAHSRPTLCPRTLTPQRPCPHPSASLHAAAPPMPRRPTSRRMSWVIC